MEEKVEKNKDYITKKITSYEELKIPGILIIGQYTDIYKDKSKSDENTFFYRCQKSNCRIIIVINRENIKKIESNKQNSKIKYIQKKSINVRIIQMNMKLL